MRSVGPLRQETWCAGRVQRSHGAGLAEASLVQPQCRRSRPEPAGEENRQPAASSQQQGKRAGILPVELRSQMRGQALQRKQSTIHARRWWKREFRVGTHPSAQGVLKWAVSAREVPHGEVLAGLLVDLASLPRAVHAAPEVAFPLTPAARTLGVSPVVVRTALRRLAAAGLVRFRMEDHPDGPRVVAILLPPGDTGRPATVWHDGEDSPV